MKVENIKNGTREEIISQLKSEVTSTVIHPHLIKCDGIFECKTNPIEKQIDDIIRSGSPLVGILMWEVKNGLLKDIRKQFIITDFADQKLNMELKRVEGLDEHKVKMEEFEAGILGYRTLKINAEIHNKLKIFCAENNLKMGAWVDKIITFSLVNKLGIDNQELLNEK